MLFVVFLRENSTNQAVILTGCNDGLEYKSSNIFLLSDAYLRRLYPVLFTQSIGGFESNSREQLDAPKLWYAKCGHPDLASNLNENESLPNSFLLFVLDIVSATGIPFWTLNNAVTPSILSVMCKLLVFSAIVIPGFSRLGGAYKKTIYH